MKFSVAPESRSALVSALRSRECRKTFNVIDCRFDKYTFSVLTSLIKADVIRRWENPDRRPWTVRLRTVAFRPD